MAKITRHFENAFESTYIARTGDAKITEQALACMNAAGEVDRVMRSLVENATRLSEMSTRFARDIASGYVHAQTPTASSIISDLTREKIELDCKREAMVALVRVTFGLDFVKAMMDVAKASFEAVAAVSS